MYGFAPGLFASSVANWCSNPLSAPILFPLFLLLLKVLYKSNVWLFCLSGSSSNGLRRVLLLLFYVDFSRLINEAPYVYLYFRLI